jgi:hypothetical protein
LFFDMDEQMQATKKFAKIYGIGTYELIPS